MKSPIHELQLNKLLSVSKKVLLLCMFFVFSATFYAQTATEKKAKVKTEKTKKEVQEKATKTEKKAKRRNSQVLYRPRRICTRKLCQS